MMDDPGLVLGPLLRHVGPTTATVWVETDRPCEVRVLDAAARTFTVHGHHFALVEIDGLAVDSATPYTVTLDGRQVWPEPDSPFPPSRIHTTGPGRPQRLVFGSCRTAVPHDAAYQRSHGIDVLRVLALQLAGRTGEPGPDPGTDPLPDLLLLLGDQVYADEPPDEMKEFIRRRRGQGAPVGAGAAEVPGDAPDDEVVDFTEYAQLYRLAWTDGPVRWLLSTVPTAMIFDDHDVRDDWNSSASWRERIRRQPWWRRRIVADAQAAGRDAGEALDTLVARSDTAPEEYRWSYHRDLDGSRLVVLDSRASRVLTPGGRTMLPPADWAWFEGLARGDVDHLLIGTSLPYLLPRGLHHLERWNEAVCDGVWGRHPARLAEWLREAFDLEHWAAFKRSFDAMAEVIGAVAAGRRGRPPASVLFLSGDVHYTYLARARLDGVLARMPGRGPDQAGAERSAVYQAVCSPIRNPLGRLLRWGNVVASTGLAGAVGKPLAALARVGTPDLDWRLQGRPRFDNSIAVLDLDGRRATLRLLSAPLAPAGLMPGAADGKPLRVAEQVDLA
jgi:hypothetical protein